MYSGTFNNMNRNKIAKITGLSTATISRFFSHPHLLSLETRNLIEATLLKNPYQPNSIAAQLAKKKKGKIAFLFPQNPDIFTYQRFQAIYYVLLSELNKIPFTLEAYANNDDSFTPEHFDYAIYLESTPDHQTIKDRSLAILYNTTEPDSTYSNYIHINTNEIGKTLAELFCPASTQTPLVLLPTFYQQSSLISTIQNFKDTLKSYKVFPNPHHFLEECNSFESALDATAGAFAIGLDFHSIIAFSQEAALGAIAAIKAEGLSYPFDMQIIHYSHPKEFYTLEHQITCLSDPLSPIIDSILKFIQGKPIRQTLQPTLIEGQTY